MNKRIEVYGRKTVKGRTVVTCYGLCKNEAEVKEKIARIKEKDKDEYCWTKPMWVD